MHPLARTAISTLEGLMKDETISDIDGHWATQRLLDKAARDHLACCMDFAMIVPSEDRG